MLQTITQGRVIPSALLRKEKHDTCQTLYVQRNVTPPPTRCSATDRPSEVPPTAASAARAVERAKKDWRSRARPVSPGSVYPAKEHCSRCGLCDTYYIAHVRDACAFLGDGMSRIATMEAAVHGRERRLDDPDELRFGVTEEKLLARNTPSLEGAQWTGIVTQIAMEMLESGKVDAVVCVQKDDNGAPKPVVARTKEDVLAARGVKPTLSPNLNVLATVEALGLKRLLFCGVGCQVQALRAVEHHLDLDALYVLGTHCVDNSPSMEATRKFYEAASSSPDTISGYEFMQDYRVHIKHTTGMYEKIPYFCLPANDLNDVIAPSCYSCFDYMNAGADLVVGYMGAPFEGSGVPMTQHMQQVTIRNAKGREMLNCIQDRLETRSPHSSGSRKSFVLQTALADDEAKMGRGPSKGAPRFVGEILASVLTWLGPKGLEFARNYIHVMRHWGSESGERHIPEFARRIVEEYDKDGAVSKRAAMSAPFPGKKL